MNNASIAATAPLLPPELDAELSLTPAAAVAMPAQDRMMLAGVAAELAALSNRAENASVEVAAIEVQMQGLVDELTTMAGAAAEAPSAKSA